MARALLHYIILGLILYAIDRQVVLGERTDVASQVDVADPSGKSFGLADPIPPPLPQAGDVRLYDMAVEMGLGEGDPVVRRRLVDVMAAVSTVPNRSTEGLYQDALDLKLQAADEVVRRRLIQKMRFQIEEAAMGELPSEAELQQYLEQHAKRYETPLQLRFRQIYYEATAGQERSKARALDRLVQIHNQQIPPAEVASEDALPYPTDIPLKALSEIEKMFGPKFVQEITAVPVQNWSGPIPSAYGFHLVYVEERREPSLPPLLLIRGQVLEALLADRAEAAVASILHQGATTDARPNPGVK